MHRKPSPRVRAVAGLHALLDHGHDVAGLRAALAAQPVTGVRAGAPVLAHRVADLCTTAGVDAESYELPPPATPQQGWNAVTDLLDAAETNHLASWPTRSLLAERRTLDDLPTADMDPAASRAAEARRARLDAALDRQATRAFLDATNEPADYLTALLGPRPTTGAGVAAWDEAAHRVEHYRHHR